MASKPLGSDRAKALIEFDKTNPGTVERALLRPQFFYLRPVDVHYLEKWQKTMSLLFPM